MIVDIGENIKKYKFKDLITLNKPIKRFYDKKKKKLTMVTF